MLVKKKGERQRVIPFYGHHFTLANAMTFHKVQAKTLKKVVVCLDQQPKKSNITQEQLLVALTRVREADDLRILPALPLNTFDAVRVVKRNPIFNKYFGGKFEDGFRVFELEPAKPKKAARRARSDANECPRKKSRKEIQNITLSVAQPPQLGLRADDPLLVANRRAEIIRGVRTPYLHADAAVIDAMFRVLGFPENGFVCGQTFEMNESGQLDYDLVERSVGNKQRFVSYIGDRSHFVAIEVDVEKRKVWWANSMDGYDTVILQRMLFAIVDAMEVLFERAFVVVKRTSPQQIENECAIFTINNCARWAFGREFSLTREDVARAYEEN